MATLSFFRSVFQSPLLTPLTLSTFLIFDVCLPSCLTPPLLCVAGYRILLLSRLRTVVEAIRPFCLVVLASNALPSTTPVSLTLSLWGATLFHRVASAQ